MVLELIHAEEASPQTGGAWVSTADEDAPREADDRASRRGGLGAAGIQVYALFFPIGRSERLITLIVLLVATVQIVICRPRAPAEKPP